jgi:hypothetical protein
MCEFNFEWLTILWMHLHDHRLADFELCAHEIDLRMFVNSQSIYEECRIIPYPQD